MLTGSNLSTVKHTSFAYENTKYLTAIFTEIALAMPEALILHTQGILTHIEKYIFNQLTFEENCFRRE